MYQEMLDSLKTFFISMQLVRGRINLNYLHYLVQVFTIKVHALYHNSSLVSGLILVLIILHQALVLLLIFWVYTVSNENSSNETPRIVFNSDQVLESSAQEAPSI